VQYRRQWTPRDIYWRPWRARWIRTASLAATAGWHARESMWLQSTEIRVRTGACGYFRVPHGRPGRTRVKCEPSQVDTGREPRGESDVRDGRHTCYGCGERDHMRERDHRCMCTERAIAARDDRCTQSVVSFPWSGRECKYIHGAVRACRCGKTWWCQFRCAPSLVMRPRHATGPHMMVDAVHGMFRSC